MKPIFVKERTHFHSCRAPIIVNKQTRELNKFVTHICTKYLVNINASFSEKITVEVGKSFKLMTIRYIRNNTFLRLLTSLRFTYGTNASLINKVLKHGK